ncbi:hypothetical protein [Ferribacterium limneticum]|uniref:hypothetical protein n=1 Tax=Ferribacterium limneticum TaxID=76259 RepID=UPI001CF94832|nr:hypothetical protein [Ferribacterium limneticum]UCV29007.1 hypothetical protein KI617_02590 [Ferribacterium limneticum]UCV32925.1 hypothetical protein KI608_02590 [Ferribacterium limneticum]
MSLSGLMAWFKVRPKFVALLQLLFGLSAVMAGLFYVHSLHTSGLLLLPENFEEKRGAMRDYRSVVSPGGKSAPTYQGHFGISGQHDHYYVSGFSRDFVLNELPKATTVSCSFRRAEIFKVESDGMRRCFGFAVDGRVVRSLEKSIAEQDFFNTVLQWINIAFVVAGFWLSSLGVLGMRGVVL